MQQRIFRNWCVAGLVGLLPCAAAAADAPQYPTKAEAEERCPGQVVVWLDPQTRTYYYRGQDLYGSTKSGGYVCERDVKGAGYKPNRTGK